MLRVITNKNKQSLKIDVPSDKIEGLIFVDIYRIDQVIRNLVTNASKFTPSGGDISIRIKQVKLPKHEWGDGPQEWRSMSRCGTMRLEVADNGVGIKKENQAHVFQQFQQFDKNSLQSGGGSGLGLWISRKIICAHQGSLMFKSQGAGTGTIFFFDLPLYCESSLSANFEDTSISFEVGSVEHDLAKSDLEVELEGGLQLFAPTSADGLAILSRGLPTASFPCQLESSTELPERQDSSHCTTVHGNVDEGRTQRFLVVDDSLPCRKMLGRMLKAEGAFRNCVVLEAEDGSDAIQLVKDSRSEFTCIFMDSVMTSVHGPQAAHVLRQELGYQGILIGLTGNALPADIEHFKSSGLDYLLLKPLKRLRLLEVLKELKVLKPSIQIPLFKKTSSISTLTNIHTDHFSEY
jgi:CheY-like chemotaxis protein